MFQSQSEKGLFTFYWQSHNEKSDNLALTPSTPNKQKQKPSKDYKSSPMEENTALNNLAQNPKAGQDFKDRLTRLLQRQAQKQNKNDDPLKGAKQKVEIKNKLLKVKQVEQKKDSPLPKEISKLPDIKSVDQVTSRKKHKQNAIQRLNFDAKQTNLVHKNTLKLAEITNKSKHPSLKTLRAAKKRKVTIKQKQNKELNEQKLGFLAKCQKVNFMKPSSEARSYLFPNLVTKMGIKRSKQYRDSYVVEQLVDRQDFSKSNSVINLGVTSVDQYRLRWQKRKIEFLQDLALMPKIKE